jgi:MFS family permease
MTGRAQGWAARLPFYFGWVIVAIAFVTMAVSVSARTAFSLLLAPLIDEFGWQRGVAAGAFSFGFLVSAVFSPFVGSLMDRQGPGLVIQTGVVLLAAGLLIAPRVGEPWHLYITLGAMVGCGANLMSFTAQSLYLPNWFRRRRGLALSIAFAGVGAGAVVILPWQQSIITESGWRASCTALGLMVLVVLLPLNLLVRRRPEDLGLEVDGGAGVSRKGERLRSITVVDADWAATEWTLARTIRTARFWWIMLGFFSVLFAWYAVQIHQTKYLLEIGFAPQVAAWALGFVSVAAIPGQIGFGALSDRIGREWVWSIACAGFAICYAALIALHAAPSQALLYVMVVSQGFLGYALTAVMGPIVAEIFEGPHYGTIFGTLTVALIGGGATGPWVTGVVYDSYGSYTPAFALAIGLCAVSAAAIWTAAPRKVRTVPGRKPTP